MTAPATAWREALLADKAYAAVIHDRLLQRIQVDSNNCWNWQGWIERCSGYGKVSIKRGMRLSHVVMMLLEHGLWSDHLVVDHLCRNRPCLNPSHLELVTPNINAKRGLGPVNGPAYQRVKTHCPKGHPYSGDNLIIRAAGHRTCRACRDEQNRRRYKS